MWEEMVTENVHSIIGICWNLKRRKGRCSTSNSWGDLYQRKKANINNEATHFTETNLSYSWGILYLLKIVSNDEKISGKKHPVIHKLTYFGEGGEVVDLTQTPRTLRSTNLIGWGIHNIKYCSNSSHYNFFAPI